MPIVCKNLTKSYSGKPVLDRWNATIPDRGITAIMGPSGIGKTTLFRLLTGLEKADDGQITGLGEKKLSVVFQEDRLFPQLTVYENLEIVGTKADMWLRKLGLWRALCHNGDVFLLDEPFQGLDAATKKNVMDIFLEKKAHKTVLFITHDQREADYLADHLLRFQEV